MKLCARRHSLLLAASKTFARESGWGRGDCSSLGWVYREIWPWESHIFSKTLGLSRPALTERRAVLAHLYKVTSRIKLMTLSRGSTVKAIGKSVWILKSYKHNKKNIYCFWLCIVIEANFVLIRLYFNLCLILLSYNQN